MKNLNPFHKTPYQKVKAVLPKDASDTVRDVSAILVIAGALAYGFRWTKNRFGGSVANLAGKFRRNHTVAQQEAAAR